MSDSPTGVPAAVNAIAYPTRPQWTLTYRVAGEEFTRAFDVQREVEARSRLVAEVPNALVTSATFNEVPMQE